MLSTQDPKVDLSEPNGIHDAVARAGTQAILAARLGVSQQAVSNWLRQGWAPTRRARQIEIAVVSEVHGCRAVGRGRVLDPQFVLWRQRVDHGDIEIARITLIAVRTAIAEADGGRGLRR